MKKKSPIDLLPVNGLFFSSVFRRVPLQESGIIKTAGMRRRMICIRLQIIKTYSCFKAVTGFWVAAFQACQVVARMAMANTNRALIKKYPGCRLIRCT